MAQPEKEVKEKDEVEQKRQSRREGRSKDRERSPLLSLSTQVDDPNLVEIDGERYPVYSGKHIGEGDEAVMMALFRRYERQSMVLARAKSDTHAQKAAEKMRDTQDEMFEVMTDIPRKVLKELSLAQRNQLFHVCAVEMGFVRDTEDLEVIYEGGEE